MANPYGVSDEELGRIKKANSVTTKQVYKGQYPTKLRINKEGKVELDKELVGLWSQKSLKGNPLYGYEENTYQGNNYTENYKNANNYIYMFYSMILDVLSGFFTIKGIEDFYLNPTSKTIVRLILENGQIALVKCNYQNQSVYMFAPFETKESDIYDNPSVIKLQNIKPEITVKKENFVIFSLYENKFSLWTILNPYLSQLETSYFVMSKLASISQYKGLLFNREYEDSANQPLVEQNINEFFNDPYANIKIINVKVKPPAMMAMKDNLISVTEKDYSEVAAKMHSYWKDEIKTVTGITSSTILNKKERTTGAEINAEQDININVKKSLELNLQEAIEQANQVFKINLSLEKNEDENNDNDEEVDNNEEF